MTTEQKAAYDLYRLGGYTLEDIAALIGRSVRTVGKWKKTQDWEGKKRREVLRETQTTDMVWDLYQYNLEVLHKQMTQWRETDDPQLISKGDVDALQKFYTQIKDKSIAWNTYVKVSRELMAFIANEDLALAKRVQESKLVDDFLTEKRAHTGT